MPIAAQVSMKLMIDTAAAAWIARRDAGLTPVEEAELAVWLQRDARHAAAFARTAYESSFLKLFYPAQFLVGLINAQPMGFYGPSSLVRDAQKHGVTVLPVCVVSSDWDNRLEGDALERKLYIARRECERTVARAFDAAETDPAARRFYVSSFSSRRKARISATMSCRDTSR